MPAFFVFNAPSTTDTYTYCHTLSLHDSRPIFGHLAAPRDGRDRDAVHQYLFRRDRIGGPGVSGRRGKQGGGKSERGVGYAHGATMPRPAQRSEEHTSELQSLMRTSSAVLCLKKQNKDTH